MTYKKHIKISALSALLLGTFTLTTAASAGESHVWSSPFSGYVNESMEAMKAQSAQENRKKGAIQPKILHVSLTKPAYAEDSQFAIELSTGDVVSGCWKVSQIGHKASFTEAGYMDIEITPYTRQAIDNGDCPSGTQTPKGQIILDKDDLSKRGVKNIRFRNGNVIDRYEIMTHSNRVELKPNTKVGFKPTRLVGEGKDRMILPMNGEKIIALHIPMLKHGADIKNEINIFARRNNLEPLSQEKLSHYGMNGGKGTSASGPYLFTDTNNMFFGQLSGQNYVEVGSINIDQMHDGMNGVGAVQKPIKVFATKAGMTL